MTSKKGKNKRFPDTEKVRKVTAMYQKKMILTVNISMRILLNIRKVLLGVLSYITISKDGIKNPTQEVQYLR